MANPASFTITPAQLNSAISLPNAQTVDTNGTVPIDAKSAVGRLMIEVVNGSVNALTVKVLKGTNPPAIAATDDLTIAMQGSGGDATKARMIGPFEASRYVDASGKLNLNFQAASGSPNAAVRVYRLPKA